MKKIFLLSLVLAIVISFMPFSNIYYGNAYAESEINVTITVNNQGKLAEAKDGSLMADKSLKVKDMDGDGKFTYDEALQAAHSEYLSADGYETANGAYGKYVSKLWGNTTSNTLFFANDKPLTSGIGEEVKAGDRLYASVNKDSRYYSDWYLFFNKQSVISAENKEIKLMLEGCKGMAYPFSPKAVSGIDIGYYEGGTFKKIGTTDENGKVSIVLEKAGEYVITADSAATISDKVTDYSVNPPKELDNECPVMVPACKVTVKAAAEPITVYVTVNNKGSIATANDGSLMASKEVKAEDIDRDGDISVDEALVAAHKAYNKDDGYSSKNGTAQKLWGINTTNLLFFVNDEGIPNGVSADTVSNGDSIYASVNKDDKYYADWYTFFENKKVNANVNQPVKIKLTGHLGMAFAEADKINTPIKNVNIKTSEGKVLATTTDAGEAELTFDKAGKYYITAEGTTYSKVTDWNLMDLGNKTNVFGTIDFKTYESKVAYTDKDYGEGPYPAGEVKFVDFFVWKDNKDAYHHLRNNSLLSDCPIMAPVCEITVSERPNYVYTPSAENPTANATETEATITDAEQKEKIEKNISEVKSTEIRSESIVVRLKSGKKAIRLKWEKMGDNNIDYYQIYKSDKKNSGYKKIYTTKNEKVNNLLVKKNLKKGVRYYFKIRGVKVIDGKKYYTEWSNKAFRIV